MLKTYVLSARQRGVPQAPIYRYRITAPNRNAAMYKFNQQMNTDFAMCIIACMLEKHTEGDVNYVI